jgi:quinoprotein glucose dehydrogenase
MRNVSFRHVLSIIIAFAALLCSSACVPDKSYTSWQVYNGSNKGIKYSSLAQVNTSNVTQLTPAWTYHTGDADTAHHSQIQCNPIVVNGTLYGVTAAMKLFAVDAATGVEKWVFDPNNKTEFDNNRTALHILINSRGIAYWTDGKGDERIFFTAGSHTFAVNAATGKVIPSFGTNGSIDLHEGLGRDVANLFVVSTSPGMVYKDLLILGTRVHESPPSAPGHIRAYHVLTGQQVWIFHTIPHPGEPGYETWEDPNAWKYVGGANTWSGFSLDEERGILFAPTGSATSDFYGGTRRGANLYANCLLALNAETGERLWHFQFMHHDLWDKDLPTPPVLATLQSNGKKVDAVVQTTKNGMVFAFERSTGRPLFDIEEIAVDTASELEGEKVWPTQPVTRKPAPFVRQTLTTDDINPYLDSAVRAQLREQMSGYRYGNPFIPPGKKPSLVFPGYDGGGEWGGPSLDPETGVLYVNANEMAWIMKMVDNETKAPTNETWLQAGIRLYQQHCKSCHSADLAGTGNNPSLKGLEKRYNKNDFLALVEGGRRMMPAFQYLKQEEREALASYLLKLPGEQKKPFQVTVAIDSVSYLPYKLEGYTKFLSPDGYPAISPPWGTLNAIDMNTGELLWKQVLGEYEELKARGVPPTGTENYGGPVVTAGGLVFIAATRDGMFRAFDKRTGKILWEYKLPAAGFATPAVYEQKGKQYIVIACGGGKLNTLSGDAYVAFALPE